jgi:hypothetical protein
MSLMKCSTKNPGSAPIVESVAYEVNDAWSRYQSTTIEARRERSERDEALTKVTTWLQAWRPVVMLRIPGANIRSLPSGGGTPDDLLSVARDLRKVLERNPGAKSFREGALSDLGAGLDQAAREVSEATAARPQQTSARELLTEASLTANETLVRGSDVVRALFGPTSPEYKQFIGRSVAADEAIEVEESEMGEEGGA